jgi:uncharacterized protein YgiM (DUF1202 family)
MRKKKNNTYSFRNANKSFFAILGDNKKYLMPAVLVVAVIITVAIALGANRRAAQMAVADVEADLAATIEIPEMTMEENAFPEVNALLEKYYKASAEGDGDTINSIYTGLEETELLKAIAASDYIESYMNIKVYTKPGPVSGSYVAYVYNEVKLYDYPDPVPGLETFYICTAEDGSLYINGDIADSNEIEYLKQVNVQADVIDLNNKVATIYNEMVNSDQELAELLLQMRSGLQVSVGEALATSEASMAASAEEGESKAEDEASAGESSNTMTTHTIRATDVINIRKSDSETADILDKTTKGQEFKQLEALANGWSRIEYKGGVAYVKTEFFEVVGEETITLEAEGGDENTETQTTETNSSTVSSTETGKMTVSETVRMRKSQSTDADIITMIYAGSTVNVVEQYANGWAKIEYKNNTGYIKSEFLKK